MQYFQNNWQVVRQTIEEELYESYVDSDAKEAVSQALTAHESGLFRLVPPSMFTAIERAVRVSLYGDRVGRFSVREQLMKNLGQLPLSALISGGTSFAGFAQLSNHLYENIWTDTDREHFMDEAVPNRHASIHGLVNYGSAKSSLNAIFVADLCLSEPHCVGRSRPEKFHKLRTLESMFHRYSPKSG